MPFLCKTQIRPIIGVERFSDGERRSGGDRVSGGSNLRCQQRTDRNGKYQDQDGFMLPRVDGDSV